MTGWRQYRVLIAAVGGLLLWLGAITLLRESGFVVTAYTYAWTGWLLAYFLPVEFLALTNDAPGDSLSEHSWDWFSIKTRGKHWRPRRIFAGALLVWLGVHILTGGAV